jgi:hypothetical protein
VTRAFLVLCTLTWWVLPGMGVIDLTVTWSSDWPVMLEAGWGVLFTIGLGLPFLATALAPRLARVALVQLYAVVPALVLGILVGREPQAWWILAMLAVELPLVHLVARGSTLGERRLSPVLLALAALAVVPVLVYAWQMAADNRRSLITSDITNGTDHYALQAAAALALVTLTAGASWWPSTRRLLGTSAALMGAYLGLVSYSWPGVGGGVSQGWSLTTMVWALTVGIVCWWRRQPSRDLTKPDGEATARAASAISTPSSPST